MSLQAEIVVDGKNELGEGVVWSSAHGEVQWTDILGRRFWTYSPSDGATPVGRAARPAGVLRAAWRDFAAGGLRRRA